MVDLNGVHLRLASAVDADQIAALHTDSWSRNYRGIYSDAFLDGDVFADRLAVWRERINGSSSGALTLIAEEGATLVGFGHVVFDDHPQWGSLLDNLHVAYCNQRAGIGSRLLSGIAAAIVERSETCGLYLWVNEQNKAAQAFYQARGGTCVERAFSSPPGGVPGRLNGTPTKLRYVWPEPATLLGYE